MSWMEDDFSGPCDGTDDNFLMSDAQKPMIAKWADKLELWYVFGLLIYARGQPCAAQENAAGSQALRLPSNLLHSPDSAQETVNAPSQLSERLGSASGAQKRTGQSALSPLTLGKKRGTLQSALIAQKIRG